MIFFTKKTIFLRKNLRMLEKNRTFAPENGTDGF